MAPLVLRHDNQYQVQRSALEHETVRPLLEQQHRGSLSPQPGISRGPRRSSLETKVLKGLRGSFEASGPRLQRSTSGLAFDDSDKENYAPK